MYADLFLLNLPNIELKNKNLLPDYSGIYFVIDENKLVWYIGQAKNLRERWKAKTHHRIFQLLSQKKKKFFIYFKQVEIAQLNQEEKSAITLYNPQLNSSPVKYQKLRPTETLLRETLIILRDYLIVVGIEPPRTQDPGLLKYIDIPQYKWRLINKVVNLSIIHLGINYAKLEVFAGNREIAEGILNNVLKTRKAYTNKWEPFVKNNPYLPIYGAARLLVNGYAVEITTINYDRYSTQAALLAGETIQALDLESVNLLNTQAQLNPLGIYLSKEEGIKQTNLILSRIRPYDQDYLKLIFFEKIDRKVLESHLEKIIIDYRERKRGFGSRS